MLPSVFPRSLLTRRLIFLPHHPGVLSTRGDANLLHPLGAQLLGRRWQTRSAIVDDHLRGRLLAKFSIRFQTLSRHLVFVGVGLDSLAKQIAASEPAASATSSRISPAPCLW